MILSLLLTSIFFGQAQPPATEIVRPQEVRPLPGELDNIPVFNSNSPELILSEGILLSTFPPEGKNNPEAHLNFAFKGRFDLFAHHVAKPQEPGDLRTLYLGILVHNPNDKPVTVKVLEGASYLSQPDAPFIEVPPVVDNSNGNIYAGPGGRVMSDILRGKRQDIFPKQIVIPPEESRMLLNVPIPVRGLEPPLNGRSTYMRLESSGEVYVASLAKYARSGRNGNEFSPSLSEWKNLLKMGKLSTPRDRPPTPPNTETSQIIYGRVAGVSRGSVWNAKLVDNAGGSRLTIPEPGGAFSYGMSTLPKGLLGTNQNQSAEMLVRYPDTAYQAHGNYGVQYSLDLPLYNPTNQTQTVVLTVQTPLKEDELSEKGLRFLEPTAPQTFFRGTVRFRYIDDRGKRQMRYVHLVQKRGQQGEPLVKLEIEPQQHRRVEFDFLYPPDASPPQVLTVKTLED
ncbi:DUF3370 domain-containing protein [Capilliphycus salinus ALCB114379]|uniref:DUF3370 domain-containing protein n=1 Tax=Capilliphycus salinus TaxID=2768948 RepID=UPI0039A65201